MFAGLPKKYPSAAWKHPADVFVGYTGPWQEAARQTAITSREEAWAAFELQYYENFFTTIEDLTVSVTTFNAGSKKPNLPMQQLVELVSVDDQGRSVPVDLIVLSFQEIDMSTAAMLREETEASMPWIAAANAAIGADDNVQGSSPYFALPTRQLVGILLCVYVRRELLPYVREHSVSTVATGALGSIGNKGAVGLHLVIHRTSICCIAAHLAAGHSNVRKRNEDINNIFQSMDFNAARRADMGSTSGALQYPELLPLTHDWTIVAGDLNYRVNLTYDKALNLIQANDVTQLLKYDQFEAELSHVPTPWAGFICPKPDFLPTYRFDIGTDRYDTSEKRRIPSFTDRIGFHPRKVEHQSHLCLRKWGSLQAIRCSDHKPVQAVARLSMRVENPDSLKQYYASLLSGIRERGYELGSQCSIDCSTTNLDFGTIQFCKPESSRELVITNTGACVAVVRVLRLVEGETTATADGMWLRVSPQEFALLPGESEVVSLRTELHPRCLPWLSRWKPGRGTTAVGLTARLMLCVRNGSDQVVKCGAVLLPSIFGNSLENIAALHEHPCMEAYGLNAGDLVRDIDEDEERANLARSPAVPKEFWYLVDAITRNPRVPGLFVTPPNDHSVTEEVAEYLIRHNDTIPDEFDVLATAECLYALLESLQEPVIPFREYQAALTAGKSRAKALAFIQTLPVLHGNLWIFMMSMLNYLLRPEHVRCNGLTPNELARVFAEVLLDRPRDVEGDDPMMKGRGENHVNMKARQISERESEEATALVLQFLDPPVDLAR